MSDDPLIWQARANRRNMNSAEVRLWWDLRRGQMGVKFRRQHVALGHLLDFACVALELNVESDGSQHQDSEADALRDAQLEAAGWTILRFWAWEVFEENEMVLRTISRTIEDLQRRSAE